MPTHLEMGIKDKDLFLAPMSDVFNGRDEIGVTRYHNEGICSQCIQSCVSNCLLQIVQEPGSLPAPLRIAIGSRVVYNPSRGSRVLYQIFECLCGMNFKAGSAGHRLRIVRADETGLTHHATHTRPSFLCVLPFGRLALRSRAARRREHEMPDGLFSSFTLV